MHSTKAVEIAYFSRSRKLAILAEISLYVFMYILGNLFCFKLYLFFFRNNLWILFSLGKVHTCCFLMCSQLMKMCILRVNSSTKIPYYTRPCCSQINVMNPFGRQPGTCCNCLHISKIFLCVLISWCKGLIWLHGRQHSFSLNKSGSVGAKSALNLIWAECFDKGTNQTTKASCGSSSVDHSGLLILLMCNVGY